MSELPNGLDHALEIAFADVSSVAWYLIHAAFAVPQPHWRRIELRSDSNPDGAGTCWYA
jgi:hypothetical protein